MVNLAEGKPVLWLCLVFLVAQTSSTPPEEREDLFEGDLNIPELKEASGNEAEFRMVLAASRFGRWPNGVMPYVISSTIDSDRKQLILTAMAEWRAKTCLKFVPRRSQKNYVEFTYKNTGCWSNGIGRIGNGIQTINLDNGCWGHGTIIHEIGHALGFWHEQSRPDRDNYVLIIKKNIKPGLESQFKKYSHGQIDSLDVVYDYGSVMHYPRRAFSKNGRDTIVPKQSGVQIGQRSRLSENDALQANLMYQCPSTTTPPQKTTTPPQEKATTPEGYIMHLQSEKCFYPAGGNVPGENHPVVLSKCHKQTGRFRMYENGTIQHVLSGMCVHPTGDCSPPEDNTELVLSKSCDGPKRQFVINLDGLLIHSSKTCVRPAQGSVKIPENTRVVIHQSCSASKFAFAFAALPRTNGNNLALGKPTQQISTYKQGVASKAVDGVRNEDYDDGFCSHTLRSNKPWWRLDLRKQERVGVVYVSNRADCCWSRLSGFEIRVGNSPTMAKNPRCGTKYSLKRGETREIICNPPLDGRFVSISMKKSGGAFLTLCEVAVYAPAISPTQIPTKPEIQGVLQHSKSKLCVLPKYEKVTNNLAVVLTAKCSKNFARFRSLNDGSLQHIDSGMCLSPKDGCTRSLKDTELVLIDQCGKMETEFSFTEKGSLMHVMSKTCVRPSSYPVSNEDTTMVVLNSLCDSTKNKFELVTVPMPTPTSLPVGGNCGQVMVSKSALVIGGVNAKPGAWPWQVLLKRDGRFICGGSLIKLDWIVTAAHCISTNISPDKYTVVLGDHDRRTKEGTEQEIAVKRYIKHPSYNKPYPINNDIALLQLGARAKLTTRINTVCLPPQGYDVPPITSKCYITGWGKIQHPGNSHPILQQGEMPPVSNAVCHEKLKKSPSSSHLTITKNMICAGKEGTDVSGCHGDSGGPYVCKDKSGRWFLQGIVSWGSPKCRAAERYTVFARAAKFRTWVDDEIKKTTTKA